MIEGSGLTGKKTANKANTQASLGSVSIDEMRSNFEALRSILIKDALNVWEVYADESQGTLIYRPIAFMELEEIVAGRRQLGNQSNLTLLGVEVALTYMHEHDPENKRRKGCFRATEWLTPEFEPTTIPKSLKDVKKQLDKESGWSRGGPR